MSAPIPEDKLAQVKDALLGGRKIEAIRIYREAAGRLGLAEAKAAVEKIEAELRASSPDKFTPPPSSKGCFVVTLVVCLIVFAIVMWLAR
jgi:hypothetical protein